MKGSRKIIVDTGALIALVDKSDSKHACCMDTLKRLPELTEFYTTESCIAESSYILPTSDLIQQVGNLLQALQITLAALTATDLHRVYELLKTYDDKPMDFADATLVAVAERLAIKTVFTLDHRDFRIYRPKHAKAFDLLPKL